MADPHIITALRDKRAELAGEIQVAEGRLAKLHAEIAAVDITLRVFDPEQKPATIRAKVKRKQSTRFRVGEMSRTLLSILRVAQQPLSIREMAAAVAAAHGIDVSTKKALGVLVANTRAVLSRPHEGVVREGVEGEYRWRLEKQ